LTTSYWIVSFNQVSSGYT